MANFDLKKYLDGKNTTDAVLVGQSTGNQNTGNQTTGNQNTGTQGNALNAVVNGLQNTGLGQLITGVGNAVGGWVSNLFDNSGNKSSGNSGGGSGGNTSGINADYKASLGDLYNKVMGYGGYSYTPYTPGTYSPTIDTSGTQANLKAALGDIQNYGDFKYDLNADMLYKQAVDNAMMQGQKAMVDTNAAAAALTGGYGNSWAASVGNQAYQDYITQANNMIPQFQQMALNTWQSGFDKLRGVYDAITQQLSNELSLEDMYFNIWAQNEANAANAHSMNSQGAYNAWAAGLDQLLGQYDVTKDYYGTLQELAKASGGSGGSSSSSKKNSSTSGLPASVQNVLNNATQAQIVTAEDWVKLLDEANKKK